MRRIPFLSAALKNCGMQRIEETYRARLLLLVQTKGKGRQRILADLLNKNPAQLSQWINASKDSKTGQPRSMEKKTAREIEASLGLPSGWMDQPITEGELADLPDLVQSSIKPLIAAGSDAPPARADVRVNLREGLEALASACEAMPANVRASVAPLLDLVVRSPEIHAKHQIPVIIQMLSGEILPTAVGQN
jgi:hypothetical protein